MKIAFKPKKMHIETRVIRIPQFKFPALERIAVF